MKFINVDIEFFYKNNIGVKCLISSYMSVTNKVIGSNIQYSI